MSKGKEAGGHSLGADARPVSEGGSAGPLRPPGDDPVGDDWAKLSQREKFIRAAREAGADETGEALDEALRAVGRARKR